MPIYIRKGVQIELEILKRLKMSCARVFLGFLGVFLVFWGTIIL